MQVLKITKLKNMSGHQTDAMLTKYKQTDPVHLLEEAKRLSNYVNAHRMHTN